MRKKILAAALAAGILFCSQAWAAAYNDLYTSDEERLALPPNDAQRAVLEGRPGYSAENDEADRRALEEARVARRQAEASQRAATSEIERSRQRQRQALANAQGDEAEARREIDAQNSAAQSADADGEAKNNLPGEGSAAKTAAQTPEQNAAADAGENDTQKENEKAQTNAAEKAQGSAAAPRKSSSQAALPIVVTADKAKYDNDSGDFEASGNVTLVQGAQIVRSARAYGNLHTGDIYLRTGGEMKDATGKLRGNWVHYNFNTQSGEIRELSGSSYEDHYMAPHAIIKNGNLIADRGGTDTRCPARYHPSCLSIEARKFTIIPRVKMFAEDVKVFVRGTHIYSRDYWENDFTEKDEQRMPKLGYDHDKGAYVEFFYDHHFSPKVKFHADMPYYSKDHWKPRFGVSWDEKIFDVQVSTGWFENGDDIEDNTYWFKKKIDYRINLHPQRIDDRLPLSYNAYASHGRWWNEYNGLESWHTEAGVYLNHDRIYPFVNSKKLSLDLGIGRRWTHESLTGRTQASNAYYGTMGYTFDSKWYTWVRYHREKRTSQIFKYDQPDMDQELGTGIRYTFDKNNWVQYLNRYDLETNRNYKYYISVGHRFCCWQLTATLEHSNMSGDNEVSVMYNFFYY